MVLSLDSQDYESGVPPVGVGVRAPGRPALSGQVLGPEGCWTASGLDADGDWKLIFLKHNYFVQLVVWFGLVFMAVCITIKICSYTMADGR